MSQHNGPRIKISNVVLYFDIEDYTGTSSWNSKVGNNASVNGTINHRETNLDKFLDLDGSTNYLQLSDYLSSLSEISINAWISPISIASEMVICALNNMVLSIKPNTFDNTQTDIIWYSNYSGSSKTYTTTITKKILHTHLAVTQNSSGDVKFYINGELKNSQFGAVSLSNTQTYKHVGSLGGSSNFFRGAVSRLIVSSIAESDNEIRNFYKTDATLLKKKTYDITNQKMVAVWNTNTSSGKEAVWYSPYSTYVFTVDWGDETVEEYTGTASHTYSEEGTYTVSISGDFHLSSYINYNKSSKYGWEKIVYLLNTTMGYTAFTHLSGLKYIPEGLTLSSHYIFGSCFELNHPNIVDVTLTTSSLTAMFNSCYKFNQPLNNWDVSGKTSFYQLFTNAYDFNQPLDNWDTSSATNMYGMFQGASVFNQDLSSWDTSNVVNMNYMFDNAQCFNQDLSSWDVSSVTTLQYAFKNCYSLISNVNFSGWDTSSVTDMTQTFAGTRFTTPGISGWDTSSVTNMNSMFSNSIYFNENIGSWDTSNVTDMGGIFSTAYRFNQDLSGWDTSNVTSLLNSFWQCGFYDSNLYLGLSGWDVSNVRDMRSVFYNNRYFNENLGAWNLASIDANYKLDNFMNGVTLSNTNYDALLNGWNSNKLAASNGVANWRTDLRPHFGNSKYTSAGASARQDLIDYGWTITDGGLQT